ncbi:lycopene cyclase [Flavobacterium sp. NST-5]|uniref:Lycopene cyclase n=1 Tax=Flavobacterium ichthyis TaxID=2698827 RepID=A0ABW9ZB68_9FLAO|nr:lycopene cyclase family protein [Flavobacterium ichthyis]NBL65029.1 lycopene cyclase [Flavobacterium ichthyis]
MRNYDYIFAGNGLAALLTLREMVVSNQFLDKTILIIDPDEKKINDKTWCFWEKPNGDFDSVVSKKWDKALFANKYFSRVFNMKPYEYKQIESLDFYNDMLKILRTQKNITFLKTQVADFQDKNTHVEVQTQEGNFSCKKLFNSILKPKEILSQDKYPLLQQHFIGWKIKTNKPAFDPEIATFMDFSVAQKGNTRFMYVLPVSPHEALLEYTLFSPHLLPEKEYEDEIVNYLQSKNITGYEVISKEQGNIPMTCYPFWKKNTKNVVNIGSAGGWTKASTGYTFRNSAKKSKKLIQFLLQKNDFRTYYSTNKFWFYDLLLLDILHHKNHLGNTIFSSMFKTAKPEKIFKFLDEETNIIEDLYVIWQCPKKPFLIALFNRIFRQ